jgi:hypothetical protein
MMKQKEPPEHHRKTPTKPPAPSTDAEVEEQKASTTTTEAAPEPSSPPEKRQSKETLDDTLEADAREKKTTSLQVELYIDLPPRGRTPLHSLSPQGDTGGEGTGGSAEGFQFHPWNCPLRTVEEEKSGGAETTACCFIY